MSPRSVFVFAAALCLSPAFVLGSTSGTALVRHAPSINGTVDGALQQMTGESATLNGGGVITAEWLVPGTPTVRLNGRPNFGGTTDASGSTSPTNYQITLNGNATLGHLVRRTNPSALPIVAAPPAPTGTRSVTINSAGDSPGSFTTLRHLTLNGNVGQFAVPPGTYGDFTANGGSGFTLGVAGATQPAVYNFQHLTLNGQTRLQVIGPVVISVANGVVANGVFGSSTRSAWLTVNVYSGGLTLNGGCNLYGYVNTPNGTTTINGNSQLIGGLTCDRLIVNGGGLLRLQALSSANGAPIASDIPVTLNEDASASIVLTASDPDGNPLSFSVVAQPVHGTLAGSAPNLTYTPAADFSGSDTFTFKANDGTEDSNVATVKLTILPVNDRPVAAAKALIVPEDTAANAILSGFDADGDTLTFAVTTPPQHGTLTGSAPNLVYTPAANFNGTDSFVYTASDGQLTSTPATFSITVDPRNDDPVANGGTFSVNQGGSLPIVLTGSDVDGDLLTFTLTSSPQHGTLSGTPPNLTYTASASFSGTDAFGFRVSDGTATSAVATIMIQVNDVNHAPVADNLSLNVQEDTARSFTLTGTDLDGDTLAFVVVAAPQHGTLSGTAPNLTYTPATDYYGADAFTFRTRDTAGVDSNLATVSIAVAPVNDAPVAKSQAASTDEDVPVAITLVATDVDSVGLTYAIVTPPAHGTLSGSAPNLTYTPARDYNGTDTFSFKASDGELDSAPATVSLTIRPINDAPVATALTLVTDEDSPLTLTLTATDVENATLTFAIVTPPAHGTLSGTAPNLTYTPAPDYHGPDGFMFKASDGELESEATAVALTVTSKNDAPVATDQAITQAQDTVINFTLAATDADGDPLTYTVLTQPQHGTLSGTAPNFTYTPSFNYRGADSLVFTASDGQLTSNQATIAFTLTPVSHAPTASDQTATLAEDTSAAVTLTATDLDGDPLAYHVVTPPLHGTLAGTAPNLTYTPAANYNGSDSFTFAANDGQADSNIASVTLTITPTNDAPVAVADSVTLAEDTPTGITLIGNDVDGDTLVYAIVTPPAHGTLSGIAPNLVYTPAPNYNGTDVFTFRVTDPAQLASNTATISIVVTPVNDVPVATARTVSTAEDTPLPVTLSATDGDGDALIYSIVTPPAHGVLAGTAPNFIYTPAKDYNGADSFTFKAHDGTVASAAATITITVTPVNDAPIAQPQTVFTSTGTPTAITLTGTDVDSTTLTLAIGAPPQHGTLTGTPPNVTYTSAADFGGFDSFMFTASDGQLTSSPATVQITSGLPPRSRTYTTTADFAAGTLSAVDTATADQISNKIILASFDSVWIANSSKGTVIKLDSETGRVLGEFQSAPTTVGSPYPSRIAIDSKGNAWVANLSHDSIVKIGDPVNGFFVDRNHNGKADSSSEFGDVLPWTGTDVSGAADEAILLYVRTEVAGVKQISIDADDNVWVGGPSGSWQKFDGKTGALLRTEPSIGQGGNGGYIAADGKMYSASSRFLVWQTQNPIASLPQDDGIRSETWASAIDSKGNLWTTRDWTSTVMKYSPTGELLGEFYHGEPWAMGIAIDANDHVWVAHSHCGHSIGHLLPDGRLVGNVEVANHGPVEVSIDRHGRIWVASSTGVVERINPLAGPLGSDGVTPVGEVDVRSGNLGGALWTYGRFTGSSFGLSSPDGFWTNVYDGQLAGTTWGQVVWNGLLTNDSRIEVEAALSANGTTFGPFQPLSLANSTPSGSGRYLKTRVRLVSSTTGETPILHDLTVGTAGYTPPTTTPSWFVSAGADIAGNWPDVIQLKGAFCHSIHAFPNEPTFAWSVVSAPTGATVAFSDTTAKRPTAQFSAQGTYVLRLTATLGAQVSTDDVQVVLTPYNRAPYPNAGYTIFRADFPPQLWLWGSVRDDGLPVGGTVTTQWEKLFGPGTVTFANPNSPATTASFSQPGVYVLKLKAFDGELVGEDVTTVWLGFSCIPTAPDGLVSWWQAAGNGDDHIGGNQAFTERGADFTEGKIGGAFRFDGVNDRVRVFAAPTLDTGKGQGTTLEFWVNPSADRTATIFECGQNTTHGFSARQLGRAIEVNFREASGTSHTLTTGTVLAVGTWTHVTASYDRASGEARIYINGTPQTIQSVGSYTLSTSYDIFMGGSANLTEFYQGLLDEVSVYNRALYADEVTAIVSHPAGKRPPVSNVPPLVNAGPDLGGKVANTPVTLAGSVTDDGQPTNGALFIQWSKVAGPGTVTFANANAASTTATFSEGGYYRLRLMADDGGFCSEDMVDVKVGALHTFEPDASLVAWWTGNNTDLDAVRKLKLERFNGAAFGTAQILQGFTFNGVDQYARTRAVSAIDVGASSAGFSVEFWFKRDSITDGPVFRWINASGQERVQAFFGDGGSNLRFHIPMVGDNGSGGYVTSNVGQIAANQWHHAVLTFDAATRVGRIYLDGRLASPEGVFTSGQPDTRASGYLYVGPVPSDTRFKGTVDEFSLFNRPLSTAEVVNLYRSNLIGKSPLDGNAPPTIAVANANVSVPAVASSATLVGTVMDDNRPIGSTVTRTWNVISGPGTVTFADPFASSTTATFSSAGTYVLRLDAHDGEDQPPGANVEVRVGVTAAEPPSSLAAWWPGNGNNHEIVHGGHDVELLNGAGYAAAKVSQGFLHDGAGSFSRVPAHADFDVGASAAGFTVEFWVRRDAITDGPVFRWINGAGQERVQGYFADGGSNLRFHIPMIGDNGSGGYVTSNVGQIAAGQWHHLALTFDATTRIGRIFLNGRLASPEAVFGSGRPDTRPSGYLYLGGAIVDKRFKGVVDEFSLYNRPLTLEEINAIYQAGADGKTPPDDNLPPIVNAGPHVVLANTAGVATLAGSVSDDNKPFGAPLAAWSTVSGPGTVTFENAASASTIATFSAPGLYLLKLTGTDQLTTPVSDLVEVRVGVSAAEAPAGIVAWWPGNNHPGEIIRGNHDLQLFNGATYGAGQVSQGFAFDGAGSFSRVPAHDDFDIGASATGFSIEFWVKRDLITDGPVFRWINGAGQERVQGYFADGGNNLRFHIPMIGDNGSGGYVTSNVGQIAAGQWHHFVLTFEATTRIARIFLNGRLASPEAVFGSGQPDTRASGYLYIGPALVDTRFKGTVDEFTLYNRPLSVDEIVALTQAGAQGKAPPDENLSPTVNAGPDVALASPAATATLLGSVTDDGKPFGSPVTTWTTVSGPGTVTFANANAANTTATFSQPGTYLLKLSATDQLAPAVFDLMEVRVDVMAAEPPSGVVAWWPGNSHPREIVRGNHDVQLFNGAGYAAGQVSQGFFSTGTGSFMRVPAHDDFDIGASSAGFTVEFWVRRESLTDGPVFRWVNGNGQERVQGYFADGGSNLRFHIPMTNDGGSGGYVTSNVGQIAINQWHHFALTFDATTRIARIFLDGRLASPESVFPSGQPDTRASGYIYLGGAYTDTRFRGVVDEFTLYNRPLRIDEIVTLAQAGVDGKTPPDDNLPPVVSAGPDVSLASTAAVASLGGSVIDDNKPLGAPVVTWSQISGPGTASFANANSATTTATFSAPGTYVLKLTATDQLTVPVSDIMEVRVDASATEPVSGIAAWWPGNGHPQEIVRGNHDLQLFNGTTYAAARVAQGFAIDGAGNFARVPAHADFDIGASSAGFTVEFWVRRDLITDGPVFRWVNSDGQERVQGYFADGGNNLRFHIPMVGDGGSGAYVTSNIGQITAGAWHHIALTFEADTRIARILIDGRLASSETVFGGGQPDTRASGYLYIGGTLTDTRFKGIVDEFTLYRRPLSVVEVAAIYNADVSGKTPPDGNQPPVVSAGPNVVLATTAATATLAGSVLDDGRPSGTAVAAWSMVNGPGTVTFADASMPSTKATFSAAGTYLLKLTASDRLTAPVADVVEVRVGENPAPLPADLAAWWPLNGDTHEVMRGGHDIVFLNGSALGAGKVLQGMTSNGAGSFARVPAHADFDIGASAAGFTIEFWVKRDTITDGPVFRWINGAGQERVQGYFADGGNNLRFHIPMVGDGGSGGYVTTNVGQITAGVWHHFALTFDHTSTVGQVYLDGTVASPAATFGGGQPDTRASGYLYVGGAITDTRFKGTVDEFSLYSRPLSAAEITAIYQAGATGKVPYATNLTSIVTLVSPASEGSFVVNTPITFRALATDTDGSVAKVEFFDGTAKLGETTTADSGQPTSFTFTLTSGLAAPGRHEVTAVVTDNGGASSTSGFVVVNIAPVLPLIAVTSPASNAEVPAGVATTLQATATYSLGAIAKVEFFDGSKKLGETMAPSQGSTYSFVVTGGFGGGAHTVTARATAADNAVGISAPVSFTATIVLPTVALKSPTVNSVVPAQVPLTLQAEANYTGGAIAKVEFYDGSTKLGETIAAESGTSTYSFVAASGIALGAHSLTAKVIADNGATAVSAPVAITATLAAPSVTLTSPVNNSNVITGNTVTLKATATQSVGTIAKIEFFDATTKLGETTTADAGNSSSYTFVVNAGFTAGAHSLTAKATASNGATATSPAVNVTAITYSGPPVAEIIAPAEDARVSAPTAVTGIIAHSALASWALDYRLKAAEGAPDEPWTTFATGNSLVGTPATDTTPAVPGTIGTFDPTRLINGIYELRLRVTDTGGSMLTNAPITLLVEGNMKIGAFSLAFEDLKVPVAGIPITVTRTYDSRDTRVGDFGPGWRLALANIRVQKNRNLGAGWYQTPLPLGTNSAFFLYYVEPQQDRLVTVTMPDGETHRFRAGAFVKNTDASSGYPDNSSLSAPASQGKYRFYPVGDTTSKLEPLDAANQLAEDFFIGGTGDQDLTSEDPQVDPGASVYNVTRFRLTTKDGTVFILDEALGLLEMRDLNGNTLVLNRDAQNRVTSVVSTLNTQPSALSSSLTIHRDATGRVDYIRDPAGNDLDYLYDPQGRLSSFTNRESNTTQFRYENAAFPNYLTKIIDPRGVTAIRSEYDASGRLIKQIDAAGKETIFNRGVDTTGRFEKVKDRLGNETTFYYDDRGNVTLKIDPLGAQTSYTYWPDSDRVRLETDHYGNVKSAAYDARGNTIVETLGASATEDPANPSTGYISRTSYNVQSAPTLIVDPDGRAQSFTYDAATNNLLTHTIGVGGSAPATTTYTYKPDGSLDTITDPLGNVTSHVYDYAFSDAAYPGAVKQITVTVSQLSALNSQLVVLRTTRTLYDRQENQLAQIITRHRPDGTSEDVVTRYRYDTENRLTATIMPDGRVTETRYNAFGKQDQSALWQSVADFESRDDAKARITRYTYDDRGNQTAVTYPDATTEQSGFDAENRKIWSQDRRGYRTYFVYDAVGRLTETIYPDADDLGGTGLPPTSSSDSRLANNPRTETQYDLVGRVRFQIDERGATTEFTYEDGCGCAMRRSQMIQHRASGNLITRYAYDQAGNVRFVTDPRGNITETRYDDQGRPTFVVYPPTDEHPSTQTETRYDALGRRIALIDQEGKTTRYRYDGLGRLVEVRQYLNQSLAASDADYHLSALDPQILVTRYAYDELGNQVSQTDALGRATTFWTDAVGRRTKRVLPSDSGPGAFETLTYDGWGNLWKRTDFAGKTTEFSYDALNRLTSKAADATHPSLGYSHAIARIEYDYDANGARKAARTYNAANTLLYSEITPRDERGRVSHKDTAGGRLSYSYHANGLLKDTVSSNSGGLNVGYRYDELNRLESVDDATTGVVRTTGYTYTLNGSLETLTLPNAVVHTYNYDSLNRLRGLIVSTLGAQPLILHSYEYKLNPSGHRRQVVEGTKTTTYTYDALYRLTNEAIADSGTSASPVGSVGYTLDKVGNRLSRDSQLSALSSQLGQSYNARDQLSGDTYNANGSTQVGRTVLGEPPATDTYDFEERLIVRTKSDGTTINLSYDADGIRIGKNILDGAAQPVSSTTWLVDTNNLTGYAQVVEERFSSLTAPASSLTRVYTYGSALISQATSLNAQPSTLNYYISDGHVNVRELTDSAGTVTDRYNYDAFGNIVFSLGTTANAYLYCGEQYDADLGLYFNRARYLNTVTGRFWSMDEFEGVSDDPSSLHKYIYASVSPIDLMDPSGFESLAEIEVASGESVSLGVRLARPVVNTVGRFRSQWCRITRTTVLQAHHLIGLSFGGAGTRGTPAKDLKAGLTVLISKELHQYYHKVLNLTLKLIAGIPGNTSRVEVLRKLAAGEISTKQLSAAMITAAEIIDTGCAGVPGYVPMTPELIEQLVKQKF